MIRPFVLVAAIACLSQSTIVAEETLAPLSVVVADNTTALLLPPLPKGASLSVLVRKDREPDEVVHLRAAKLRFATHFVYCSGCESPLAAIYRERLQNHGAVVIDLRTLSRAEFVTLLKLRVPNNPKDTDVLTFANLFPRY